MKYQVPESTVTITGHDIDGLDSLQMMLWSLNKQYLQFIASETPTYVTITNREDLVNYITIWFATNYSKNMKKGDINARI